MFNTECESAKLISATGSCHLPTLDRDLRVRRFQNADTHRIHNLFLEETRCLLWPMFVQTVRGPPAVLLHIVLLALGVLFARSFVFALFGVVVAVSVIFVYIYRWFHQYLTTSLKGDLANITQVSIFRDSPVNLKAVTSNMGSLASLRVPRPLKPREN